MKASHPLQADLAALEEFEAAIALHSELAAAVGSMEPFCESITPSAG